MSGWVYQGSSVVYRDDHGLLLSVGLVLKFYWAGQGLVADKVA